MKKWILSLLAFMSLGTTQAQFFGGYADGITNAATGNNSLGSTLRVVYDDFTFDVAGDIVNFGLVGRDNTGAPVAMYYEIRSGMSSGNGGTLLFSGTSPTAVFSALPLSGAYGTPPSGSGTYGLYEGGPGPSTPIHLEAGTYWVGLAPLQQFGSFDVTSTQGQGAMGHPIDDGNAFYYNSSDPLANFISLGASDFGLRIDTLASTIPEPSNVALIGLAALSVFLWRRQ